jgi:uncharacterized membrane protein
MARASNSIRLVSDTVEESFIIHNLEFMNPPLRPRLTMVRTPEDWVIEVLSAALMLTALWIIWHGMATLPDRIPTHFNAAGEVDGYGDRSTLLFLLIPTGVLYILLTALWSFPHWYNYLVPITLENAPRQYFYATRMIMLLKMEIMGIFAFMAWGTVRASEQGVGLPAVFMPAVLCAVFGTIGWSIVRSLRAR